MPLTKTVVVQILPDETARAALEEQAKESARWMNTVFRRLYTDKRNYKWVNYGPDKEWGKSYGSIVRWKPRKEDWHVVGEALYPAFIRKDAPNRIESPLNPESLQLLSQKVATTWGNFIGSAQTVPRPRGHLPNMGGVAIYNVPLDKFEFGNDNFVLRIKGMVIPSVGSNKRKFGDRLELIKQSIAGKKAVSKTPWAAVEIRKAGNKWYAHIPVTVAAPEPMKQPDKVMGIDVGVRNLMTAAVVNTKTEIPMPLRVSGMPVVHRLERIKARVRRLRSMHDRGNKNTRKVLKRLKGERRKIQQSVMRQVSAHLVDAAVESGATGIAVEDLRKMGRPDMSRRMNRLISGWSRGDGRDFLAQKATEAGLNFKEVIARGTSSTCPRCGKFDRTARDRTAHLFTCKVCGFAMNDDDVGAVNIARRGYNYWNSPKWAKSQSTAVAGTTAEDSAGNGAGESHNPHMEQPDAESPAARNGAQSEKPENRAIGTDTRVSATSSGSSSRAEPSKVQRPMRQVDKPDQASGEVARGAPGGARTVKGTAENARIDPATASGDPHPLENGARPLSVSEPPPSQRLANL